MNLSFRICHEEDLTRIDPAFTAAYGFAESRKEVLHHYWTLQPDGCWMVLLDENPIGFGGAVDFGAFSYLGMIAVHPSVQRRGIGEALVKQILAWGERRGCPTMLLDANEHAVSLYKRLGFIEEGTILRFVQNERVRLVPTPPDLHLLQLSDVPDLTLFDTSSFGAERSKIFMSYLTKYPDRAFAARSDTGQITGYIFAQPWSLGPWVASTPEVADRLLVQALSLPFTHLPSVTIPALNDHGQQLLKRYAFDQRGTNRSMRRGSPTPHRQLALLYGETSPALG